MVLPLTPPPSLQPEVIQGDRYYAPSGDMWSLGVCLYAMLCGFLPFDDQDLKRLGAKIRRGKNTGAIPPLWMELNRRWAGLFKEPEHLSAQALDLLHGLINVDAEVRPFVVELALAACLVLLRLACSCCCLLAQRVACLSQGRLTMAQVLRHPWTLGPNPATEQVVFASTISKQLDRQVS